MIQNPILPGFNPDPSICRVGQDYYIATSTFEWYPGVCIYHSSDLANWELVARPLNRASLLDMRGNPDSCGIWAPCLSYADGKFWLVYTDVKRLDGSFKDAHNYITTCETIDGEWSDPIYVNSSGFDPSLFHDDDGQKYFMNMQWNHRGSGTGGNPVHDSFDGILLQRWNPEDGLSGEPEKIFDGSDRGLTEAPHIFKRGDYYYLTTAEGGTGYDHAVTLARSTDIFGPYELHPESHVMTTKGNSETPLQRVGHGQYVETPEGEIYHTFLCGRPIPGPDGTGHFCPLGRETGIERCVWKDDGWLYLETDMQVPRFNIAHNATTKPTAAKHYTFDGPELPSDFQWLRTPYPERIFHLDQGKLVLTGRESIGSWFEQALVARRQTDLWYEAETTLEFEPETYQQAAGLTTYYNRHKFHAVVITHSPDKGRVLSILSCPGDYPAGALSRVVEDITLPNETISLKVCVDNALQQFYWKSTATDWQEFGPKLNASVISDEGGRGEHGSFTGAFVGMVAFDITGQGRQARFADFRYSPGQS